MMKTVSMSKCENNVNETPLNSNKLQYQNNDNLIIFDEK